MARIDIDGCSYEVQDGGNLLSACLSLGLDLPYFCWHPALGSAGACRQCAVLQFRDAEDQRGRLVMACMTPVADNLRVSLADATARQFRADNIELLMTNHPHDCPVCEEGGECHLQDMTLMSGHTSRRYRGLKRTHDNQNLGPFINHEMNRCIACYRCLRFYGDYAGGKDLQALGSHNQVYFGRFEDGALENEFSGNLVEVCPTGVFTDKTFSAHYARKWDLQTAPSICAHCGVGCNTAPGERYGQLRRIVNRYNGAVNGYFLCDRGRFGYGFVNSPKRLRQPRVNGSPEDGATAERHFRQLLDSGREFIGIASPRASLEANFALRALVGVDNFYLGLDDTEQRLLAAIVEIMRDGGVPIPSLAEVEQADAVLILGEDLTHSAPRLALALRQAARNATLNLAESLNISPWQDAAVRNLHKLAVTPVVIASICATRLDDVASCVYRAAPEDLARLGFAVAHCLDRSAPAPESLTAEQQALAAAIAESLKQARRPLVVSGISAASLAVVQAAYNIAKALPVADKQLLFAVPECNSLGLAILGGKPLREAFQRAGDGKALGAVIVENDLYRRAETSDVEAFVNAVEQLVVIDSLDNPTTAKAGLLLPAATFAESEGTWVSHEGRAQRYFPVFPAAEPVRGSWQWLVGALDENGRWRRHDELTAACAATCPDLADIIRAAPSAQYTVAGCKIPRQAHRYSGRTAMHADVNVKEPEQPQDLDTPFAFSMEGDSGQAPPALLPVIWAPGWNSNQAVGKFQQPTGGALRGGDAGVRLFAATGALAWFSEMPSEFVAQPGCWRVTPLLNIFGSEELSLDSPPIDQRLPVVAVVLNPEDAAGLGVAAGDSVSVLASSGAVLLTVLARLEPSLPSGLLGVTAGLPAFQAVSGGAWVGLQKARQGDGHE